jgi:hypothetical protein
MLIFFLLALDTHQAHALSYLMDERSIDQTFHMNIEEIHKDNKNLVWIENTNMVYDAKWNSWQLTPYPGHMDCALYYALIFEEQSILTTQIHMNNSTAPPVDILPIPECPTLFLIGLGLLGMGAFIRCGAIKKRLNDCHNFLI